MVMQIGRICVKTAGREAGKKACVVDVIDKNYVLIDGQVKRKRCSVMHLEPLTEIIKIEKNASHDTIVSEFKKLGIAIKEKKPKEKKKKPKKIRGKKKKIVKAREEEKPKKKALFTIGEKKEKKTQEAKVTEEKKERVAKAKEEKMIKKRKE